MAEENHVFAVQRKQFRTEKGKRSAHTTTLSSVFMIFLSFGTVNLLTPREDFADPLTGPKIKSLPNYAELGKFVVISCEATSNDSITLRWHFSRRLINEYFHYSYSPTIRSNQITRTNTLVFRSTSETDLLLRCSSRSKTSPLKSLQIANYKLKMYHKPILLGSNYTWRHGVGGEGRLYCRFKANPLAAINWYLNGKQIVIADDENRVAAYKHEPNSTSNATYVLAVNGIIYADYGNYKCVAKNELGNAEGSIEIRRNYGRIGNACLEDYDCFVAHSFCNLQNNSCDCLSGYYGRVIKKKRSNVTCVRVSKITDYCEYDEDCVDQFSVCDFEMKICRCDSNFVAIRMNSRKFSKCLPIRKDLFSYCVHNEQCQMRGSTCVDNLCLCDDRHKHHWNQTARNDSCVEKTFLFTACSGNFCELGGFPHSICEGNRCVCTDGYRYNRESHQCEGFDPTAFVISLIALMLLYLIPQLFLIPSLE